MKRILIFVLLLLAVLTISAKEIITPAQIYWITRLDVIKAQLPLIITTTFLIMLVSIIGYILLLRYQIIVKTAWKIVVTIVLICTIINFITSTTFSYLLPTTKEMLIIVGIPAIVNNENLQEAVNNVFDKINTALSDSKKQEVLAK